MTHVLMFFGVVYLVMLALTTVKMFWYVITLRTSPPISRKQRALGLLETLLIVVIFPWKVLQLIWDEL
jgi:hypothetical protein